MDFHQNPFEIFPNGQAFGMLKVSGRLDDYSFEGKFLMPKLTESSSYWMNWVRFKTR